MTTTSPAPSMRLVLPLMAAIGMIAFAAVPAGAARMGVITDGRVSSRHPGGLPSPVASPAWAHNAPFTPLVLKLLHQLEPAQPDPEHDPSPALLTTPLQLLNADALLHGTNSSNCTTVGSNAAPTGTTPAIAPLCWADALGVNVTSGAQVRQTTAPPLRVAMASSWNPGLTNAWGQVEGREARWLGVTGIYGPQVDLLRIPDWGRNPTILGEDPFQDGTLAAGEVNGTQGKGLMDQPKHFAMYNGQIMDYDAQVQDQAAHELYLTPYEYTTTGSSVLPHPGMAASMMCSYARYEIVAAPGSSAPASALGPTGGDLSCDNSLKNKVARKQWHWQGFFASDYALAMDSTIKAMESGTDQEMPTSVWFGAPLVAAVEARQVPLSTFNLALARILYQEQRFHLLGHADANSNYLSP
jgi:beta-glucosidase